MYQKPEMKILELDNKDIILTSLVDKGDVSIDDIPEFVWPDNP